MLTLAQIAERKKAIGGSDVLHLVGLAPFGCTRRLWYDKKGVPEDFPFRGNRHTKRGDIMEEYAVDEYACMTARGIEKVRWKLDDEIPYFGVHADRLQEIIECGPKSLLEVKCPTSRWFYACRNRPTPPNEATLQAQWGMMMWRLREATVLMFSADAWMAKWWDIKNDDLMQSDLRTMGIKFWASLKKADPPYAKLESHDPRCRECPWRNKCHGLPKDMKGYDPDFEAAEGESELLAVNSDEADAAMLEYIAAKAVLSDAKAQHEIAKAKMIGIFPRPGRIDTHLGTAKLKTVYRGEYTAVVKPTTYPLITVKQKVEDPYDAEGDIETY
jgi:hypothetical protein